MAIETNGVWLFREVKITNARFSKQNVEFENEKKYQIRNHRLLKMKTKKQIQDKTNISYSYVKYRRGKMG